jgi:hypothetical protein
MTNAWDGLIYLLLTVFVLIGVLFNKKGLINNLNTINIVSFMKSTLILGFGFFIFSLPFSINFKPFVSGVGILCSPSVLNKIGKIGPFLFEADHCQKSPIWQILILYGFFYIFVLLFLAFIRFAKSYKITKSDKFVLFLILLSTILIIVPEFIYIKDIYPLHYRANTMFKLIYDVILSVLSDSLT